jgi:hypothetical protein
LRFDPWLDNDITLIIDYGLQFLGRKPEQIPDFIRKGFEKPDMYDGNYELDMAHTFAAHFFFCHLYPTSVADNPFVADALIFTAIAFIILYRTENPFAEKTVAFRFIGTVVDRFWFEHLAEGPLQDIIRRSQANRDAVEILLLKVGLFL